MKLTKGKFIPAIVLTVSSLVPMSNGTLWAQSPSASSTSQSGTVKAVSANSITLTTNAQSEIAVTVPEGARLLRVAPGSTNLSAAQVISFADISVGDKVLITGKSGDAPGSWNASRVVLIKSTDIAQKHAEEQADWQKRGAGGIVNSVDAGTGTITFTSGANKIQIHTTGTTIFRRYAGDSIKFEDAKPGTVAQIQPGDQLEVRGSRSEDRSSIQAEEVVSGAFRNLSGVLATVDPAAGSITLKDLTTKKVVTVMVTTNSDLRNLPPEIATRFAARQHAGSGAAGAQGASQPNAGAGAAAAGRAAGGGRAAGMDLSKMLARLPKVTVADLHVGDAVMIVASQSETRSDMTTAVTLLDGVEPILTASGSDSVTLSPWSVGNGAPEAEGAPQ